MAKLSNDIKSEFQASQNHENEFPNQSSREQITEFWKPKARVVPESSEPAKPGRSSQYLDMSKTQPAEPDSSKVKLIKQEKQPKALSSSGFMALKKNSYQKPENYFEPVPNDIPQRRPNVSRPPVIVNEDSTVEPEKIHIEKTKPRLKPKIKREPLPEQKSIQIPSSEPEHKPKRTPIPEPIRIPIPEATRTPIPEPVRTPIPEPTRTTIPEPVRTTIPEPKRATIPEPVRTPMPVPIRTPIPEPELKPNRKRAPERELEPKRKSIPEAESKRKPKPESKQAPQSKRKRKPKVESEPKSKVEQKPKPNRKPKQKNKIKRTPVQRIANILFYTSLVFILVSLVLGYHITIRPIFVFGHTVKSVVTDCLDDIPENSLVIIQRVDRNELVVGDAITFYLDQYTVLTQRVTEIHPVGIRDLAFGTSGLGATHDILIHGASVIGRVVLYYPDLGPLLVGIPEVVMNPDYLLPVLGAYVGIVVLLFVLRGLFSKGKIKKSRKKTAPKEKSHAQMS